MRTATTTMARKALSSSPSIACVGAAVAVREASLSSAVATMTASIEANYAARKAALAHAYALSTDREVKVALKTAWSAFKSDQRVTQRTWKSSRDSAWKTFRSSLTSCKASGDVSDHGNSGAEVTI